MKDIALSLLDAAEFASLAYESPATVSAAYSSSTTASEPISSCVRLIDSEPQYLNDPLTDLQAYVFMIKNESQPTLLVTVRGTNSIQDCFNDLQACLAPFPDDASGACVHEGFLRQYMALSELLHPALQTVMDETAVDRIVFVGHSLGAAISVISTYVCARQYPQRVYMFGFGSPKVGNPAFTKQFRSHVNNCLLVKHACDPFTKIMVGPDYEHVQPQTHFGKFDMYPELPLITDLPDHRISKYISSIQDNDVDEHPQVWQQALQKVFGVIVHLIFR